jgi:long-subunit fatty acid transport protein
MHTDNVPELETLPGGDTAGESSVASQAKARSRLNTHLNTPALSYQLNEAHIRSSRLKVERLTEQDNTLHLQLMKRQWKPVQPPLLKEPTNQSPKDMLP